MFKLAYKTIKFNQTIGIKIVSLLLVISFLMPVISWAFEPANYSANLSSSLAIQHLGRAVTIPEKFARVQDSYQGNHKTIISIQDLHCHYEVQKNIAAVIKHLVDTQHLKLVAVEGASGPVNTGLIRDFPMENAKQMVSDYLVKQGKLTGADYIAATAKEKIILHGIETQSLYDQSLAAVQGFLNAESQGIIYDLKDSLNELKTTIYHQPLIDYDQKQQDYYNGQLDLVNYCAYLLKKTKKLKIETEDYQQFKHYLELDETATDTAINSETLFLEIDQIDRLIRQQLYTGDEQSVLDQYGHRLEIMEKLLNISANQDELNDFRKNREQYKSKAFVEFINSAALAHPQAGTSELSRYDQIDYDVYRLDHYLALVEQFYHLADERSIHFVDNLIAAMDEQGQQLAVIVNGGFHATKVTEELKKRGLSYLSIQPNMTRLDMVNPYFELLQNKESSLEKLLVKNQTILSIANHFQKMVLPKSAHLRAAIGTQLAVAVTRLKPKSVESVIASIGNHYEIKSYHVVTDSKLPAAPKGTTLVQAKVNGHELLILISLKEPLSNSGLTENLISRHHINNPEPYWAVFKNEDDWKQIQAELNPQFPRMKYAPINLIAEPLQLTSPILVAGINRLASRLGLLLELKTAKILARQLENGIVATIMGTSLIPIIVHISIGVASMPVGLAVILLSNAIAAVIAGVIWVRIIMTKLHHHVFNSAKSSETHEASRAELMQAGNQFTVMSGLFGIAVLSIGSIGILFYDPAYLSGSVIGFVIAGIYHEIKVRQKKEIESLVRLNSELKICWEIVSSLPKSTNFDSLHAPLHVKENDSVFLTQFRSSDNKKNTIGLWVKTKITFYLLWKYILNNIHLFKTTPKTTLILMAVTILSLSTIDVFYNNHPSNMSSNETSKISESLPQNDVKKDESIKEERQEYAINAYETEASEVDETKNKKKVTASGGSPSVKDSEADQISPNLDKTVAEEGGGEITYSATGKHNYTRGDGQSEVPDIELKEIGKSHKQSLKPEPEKKPTDKESGKTNLQGKQTIEKNIDNKSKPALDNTEAVRDQQRDKQYEKRVKESELSLSNVEQGEEPIYERREVKKTSLQDIEQGKTHIADLFDKLTLDGFLPSTGIGGIAPSGGRSGKIVFKLEGDLDRLQYFPLAVASGMKQGKLVYKSGDVEYIPMGKLLPNKFIEVFYKVSTQKESTSLPIIHNGSITLHYSGIQINDDEVQRGYQITYRSLKNVIKMKKPFSAADEIASIPMGIKQQLDKAKKTESRDERYRKVLAIVEENIRRYLVWSQNVRVLPIKGQTWNQLFGDVLDGKVKFINKGEDNISIEKDKFISDCDGLASIVAPWFAYADIPVVIEAGFLNNGDKKLVVGELHAWLRVGGKSEVFDPTIYTSKASFDAIDSSISESGPEFFSEFDLKPLVMKLS